MTRHLFTQVHFKLKMIPAVLQRGLSRWHAVDWVDVDRDNTNPSFVFKYVYDIFDHYRQRELNFVVSDYIMSRKSNIGGLACRKELKKARRTSSGSSNELIMQKWYARWNDSFVLLGACRTRFAVCNRASYYHITTFAIIRQSSRALQRLT